MRLFPILIFNFTLLFSFCSWAKPSNPANIISSNNLIIFITTGELRPVEKGIKQEKMLSYNHENKIKSDLIINYTQDGAITELNKQNSQNGQSTDSYQVKADANNNFVNKRIKGKLLPPDEKTFETLYYYYVFDERQRISKIQTSQDQSDDSDQIIFSYDKYDRLSDMKRNGNQQDYTLFSYTPSGKLKSIEINLGDTKITNLFTYNNKEQLTNSTILTESDSFTSSQESIFTDFDERGNWQKMSTFEFGQLTTETTRVSTYWP